MRNALTTAATLITAAFFVPAPVGAQTSAQTRPAAQTKNAKSEAVLVRLAPDEAQTLAHALRQVSRQGNVSFVCEGKPFRALHTAPPLLSVIAKWPRNGLPLDEAVREIADAYDYEAERKGGVFLLRKRYTNPADLPDLTADELRLALRDASRAASALPAPTVAPADENEANSPFASAFFKTLPPEIQEKFNHVISRDAKPALPVNQHEFFVAGFYGSVSIADMTPAQKSALWSVAFSRYTQAATEKAKTACQALLTLEQKGAFFVGKSAAQGENEPDTLIYTPKRNASAVFPTFAKGGIFDDAPPLPADYDASGAPLPVSEPEEGAEAQTLQSLCTGTNAARFLVDPALQAKSVLVIAAPTQNADALLQASGDVYGLRVLHEENDIFRIIRFRTLPSNDLSGLNASVLSAFPVALLRAFRGAARREGAKELARQIKEIDAAIKGDAMPPPYNPKSKYYDDLILALGIGRFQGETALRNAALHRFRVLLTPRLAKGAAVSSDDLTLEEKQMLFFAIASDGINAIADMENNRPAPTRAALEQGYFFGVVIGNENDARLRFYINFRAEKNAQSSDKCYIGNITPAAPAAPAVPK